MENLLNCCPNAEEFDVRNIGGETPLENVSVAGYEGIFDMLRPLNM